MTVHTCSESGCSFLRSVYWLFLAFLNDIGILVDEFRFMDASYSYLSVIAAKDCVIRAEGL